MTKRPKDKPDSPPGQGGGKPPKPGKPVTIELTGHQLTINPGDVEVPPGTEPPIEPPTGGVSIGLTGHRLNVNPDD